MPEEMARVTVLFVLLGWLVYCAVIWMMGYDVQTRPTRRDRARFRVGAVWLRRLVGVGPEQEELNVPLAMAQLVAIISAAVALGVALYMLVVPGALPFTDRRPTVLDLPLLLIAPFIPYLVTEAAVWYWKRRRVGQE